MNWTEEATEKMDAILAKLPQRTTPVERCKAVKDACPYGDPIKVKAWKSLATNRINPGKTKKALITRKYRGDDAEEIWVQKNLR